MEPSDRPASARRPRIMLAIGILGLLVSVLSILTWLFRGWPDVALSNAFPLMAISGLCLVYAIRRLRSGSSTGGRS